MKIENYSDWITYFASREDENSRAHLEVVGKLQFLSLPIVLDFRMLADSLGLDRNLLAKLCWAPELFYRSFFLEKSDGTKRQIFAPTPVLTFVQRWIKANILERIDLHPAAHGYVTGRSVVTNAREHLDSTFLLKMDIKNFFPSISENRVIGFYESVGYSKSISVILAKLCTYHGFVVQGAPTSPTLSNIICRNMDRRLQALSREHGFSYTRYADDLTFSGKSFEGWLPDIASKIIAEEGFSENKKKRKIVFSKRKLVTGISVSGDRISLPREKKRYYRKIVYFVLKYGVDGHIDATENYDPKILLRIMGYLAFWLQVEPDSKFAQNALSEICARYIKPYRQLG